MLGCNGEGANGKDAKAPVTQEPTQQVSQKLEPNRDPQPVTFPQEDSSQTENKPREPRFGPTNITTAEAAAIVAASKPVAEIPSDPVSTMLVERLRSRWDALTDKNYFAAYAFETPAYRSEAEPKDYANQFGPGVDWHGIEPIRINYLDDKTAEVGFLLDHTIVGANPDQPLRFERFVTERWVQEGGEWWHQSQSVNMQRTPLD